MAAPGWFETAAVGQYPSTLAGNVNQTFYIPVDLNITIACTEIRIYQNSQVGPVTWTCKLALYRDNGSGSPGNLIYGGGSQPGQSSGYVAQAITETILPPARYWVGFKGSASNSNDVAGLTQPSGTTESAIKYSTEDFFAGWGNNPSVSNGAAYAYAGLYANTYSIDDIGTGAESIGLAEKGISIADTATGADGQATDTGAVANRYVGDAGVSSEAIYAPIWMVVDTGGVDPELGEVIVAPIFPITDTATGADLISRPILDAGAGSDVIAVAVTLPTITDTAQGNETIVVTGNTPTPPGAAATGGLDAKHVLRLIYGNDKRNPIRTLDLADTAEGHIFLQSGGFAPESGELLELWSGQSIRFEGQKKLAESRDNSRLTVTYDLSSGSQAGLSALQRAINRFFLEAKTHQLYSQGESVWLEYRWSDSLATLPTPKFGQLSYYYQVYSAKAPKWPADLHNNMLLTGNVLGASLEITGSPAPEGLSQRAARAGGTITLHDKGVLIASGTSSRLHWPGYTDSGLTGQFTVTGWFTLNAAWSSGTRDIFDYYVNASNRIRIQYDAGNTRFTITKIVSGTTFTANSSTFAIANGDNIHLQLVQDATTLRLYVNGTQIASVTATATMTDGGLIALGCPATGTIDGVDIILDGWRIFADDLTSTQAAQLYTAELPVKQQNQQVGPPPYFWTKDGDDVVDNVDDSSRDNWGIIGGVGGDLEAKTRISVTWTTTYARDIWLGLKAQDGTFNPSNLLWSEFNTLTDIGSSIYSAGSYRQQTVTTQSARLGFTQVIADASLLYNRYRVLARVISYVNTTSEYWWRFGENDPGFGRHSYNIGGSAAIDVDDNHNILLDFGDVIISSDRDTAPNRYSGYINVTAVNDIDEIISWDVGGDFVFLLPWPYAKIVDAGDSWGHPPNYPYILSIEDGYAYTIDTNDNFAYIGAPIRALPHKYNYLFLMQVDSSINDFQTDTTATIEIWITPRYLLPGGMVG